MFLFIHSPDQGATEQSAASSSSSWGGHQALPRMLADVVMIEFFFPTAHFLFSFHTTFLPSASDLKEVCAVDRSEEM